jgi:hypothetical protein
MSSTARCSPSGSGDARATSSGSSTTARAREALRRHRGREIDRADGFFLIFDSAADAAGYALDYHAVLSSLGMAAKVGLHVGEVTLRETPAADVAAAPSRSRSRAWRSPSPRA